MFIPLGFSMSKVINIFCKSVGLAPLLPLPTVFRAVVVPLIGISLSELGAGLSLLVTWKGTISSALAWLFEIFPVLNGDDGARDCSGGDGRGDDEYLPFTVVVADIPVLYADLGGAENPIILKASQLTTLKLETWKKKDFQTIKRREEG